MLSIIRDQHDSSHHTEAEFSYNSWLYIRRHSSKPLPISRLRFQYIKIYFFFQILHKKSRKHLLSNMFCVFLHFLRSGLFRNSAISSSDSRERHFFTFTINPSSLVFRQMYHRIDSILLASSKYGKRQSETAQYLYWIIMNNYRKKLSMMRRIMERGECYPLRPYAIFAVCTCSVKREDFSLSGAFFAGTLIAFTLPILLFHFFFF